MSRYFLIGFGVLLASACGDDKDPLATAGGSGVSTTGGPSSGDPSGPGTGSSAGTGEPTGGEPTTGDPGSDPHAVCQAYINCVAVTTPAGLPDAQAGFGDASMCWSGTPADAELCGTACGAGIDQAHEQFPDEPACDPCMLGLPCTSTQGTFLLAIATGLGPGLPFQFIVEGELPLQPEGTISLTAQPLSLDMMRVTVPRQPVGMEYVWDDVEVAGGLFEIPTGVLTIPGEANPIFGVTVQVNAVLSGQVMGPDLFCGTLMGDVIEPVPQSLDGASWAAVRVTSVNQLPADVTVNCDGMTVTDP